MDSDEARRARAAARASLPIRRLRLDEESAGDLSALTPEERVAMVWRVTLDAWAASGRPIPDYDRAHAPGRIIRGARDDA